MKPFTQLTAVAAPLELANVDNDKIFPSRFGKMLRTPETGYGGYLFHDMRFHADGRAQSDFVLNQPGYSNAAILVAGINFGCGSSREAAVYALVDYGITVVIAPSFGDIHYANELQNGMLPVILAEDACQTLCRQLRAQPGTQLTIDLVAQRVVGADGSVYRFDIDDMHKQRLLQGLDEIGLVMQFIPQIEAFEARYRADLPWRARGR